MHKLSDELSEFELLSDDDFDQFPSVQRSIDRNTLISLLEISAQIERRSYILTLIGIDDKGSPVTRLFSIVLDAIGTPPNGFISEGQEFSRADFNEMFFNDFVVEEKYDDIASLLDALIDEARDSAAQWNYHF